MLRRAAVVAALGIGAILGTGTIIAYAQNSDAITRRQEVMGKIATASLGNYKMMKGEVPFDLPKLQAALKTMESEAGKFKALFPPDSKTGGDTEAKPKIWKAKAEFEAAADKLVADIKAAARTIRDEATIKSEYPKVAKSCEGCHTKGDGFAPSLADSLKRLK
jgi:cytochrome c556